jgi:cell division septation protein DedD
MSIRDAERFKDKVEVSLDSKQIFFLFFGGAVVACLVFVLGVSVGRRLEGRDRVARRAATSAAVDPLAALDELGADEQASDGVVLPGALADKERERPLGRVDVAKPADAKAADAKPVDAKPVDAKPADAKPADAKASEDRPEGKSADDKPAEVKRKGRYTLQISSFQDRREAESFLAKLSTSGYRAYITSTDVEGKGLFYRVRVGEYAKKSDAQDAKREFEKSEHILAYVTKI